MTSNILVKISAVVLVILALFLGITKLGGNAIDNTEGLPNVGGDALDKETLIKMGIEGDTPDNTVQTLVLNVKESKKKMNELKAVNTELRNDNVRLQDMENNIHSKLKSELASDRERMWINNSEEISSNRSEMKNMFDSMRTRFDDMKTSYQPSGAELNQGMGFSGNDNQTIWLSPMGKDEGLGAGSMPWDTGQDTDINSLVNANEDDIPAYTIAKNSTLVGSTAMTALVGRVPVGENVVAPYSFKVIVGKKNLIANGKEVPELAYAIASGKAIGDWTLSCISGEVNSLTFVFEDGRIRTIPRPRDITNGTTTARVIKIGELSDDFGNPCISGRKISNASEYLAGRVAVLAVSAAAQAAAASQTTQTVSNLGGAVGGTSIVTGSKSNFILGRTLSGASDEAAKWLRERQAANFDVIYADPGAKVAVHITEELKIDYEVEGRMTHHAGFSLGGNYRELD